MLTVANTAIVANPWGEWRASDAFVYKSEL